MSALIGSLAGFLSSFIPELFHFLRDSKDKEHELRLIDRQIEAIKIQGSSRLDEIQIKAEAEESKYLYLQASYCNIKWVDGLSALVRPLITYTFFLLYIALKVAIFHKSGNHAIIWTSEDQGIFCAVIGFWFGQRSFKARMESNGNGWNGSNGGGSNGSKSNGRNGYKH